MQLASALGNPSGQVSSFLVSSDTTLPHPFISLCHHHLPETSCARPAQNFQDDRAPAPVCASLQRLTALAPLQCERCQHRLVFSSAKGTKMKGVCLSAYAHASFRYLIEQPRWKRSLRRLYCDVARNHAIGETVPQSRESAYERETAKARHDPRLKDK